MDFKNWMSDLRVIRKGKPNVAIVGGIHGDEPGGCLGVMDFLHQKTPNNVVVIPCANTWGLQHNKRTNQSGVDINRHFQDKETKESSKIKEELKGVKLCVTIHENTNSGGFFLYYSDKSLISVAKSIVNIAKHYFPIKDGKLEDRKIDKCLDAKQGLVYCPDIHTGSLEDEMAHLGIPCICLELPKEHHLATRRKAVVAILSSIT